MTNQQISWAKSHDWFIKDLGNGSIIVKDDYTVRTPAGNVILVASEATFNDFRALRDWAGY